MTMTESGTTSDGLAKRVRSSRRHRLSAGAEATQAATLAGAQSTQAAAHAGSWATMAAGAIALVVGMFLGLAV